LIPAGDIIDFSWEKGNDYVHMRVVKPIDKIDQEWRFDDDAVKIVLNYKGGQSLKQTWDFGETKYTKYNKTEKWLNGKEDPATLQKYKSLIAQWCNEHQKSKLGEDVKCIIY